MKPVGRSLRRSIITALNAVLAGLDLRIIRKSWHDALVDSRRIPDCPERVAVPEEARRFLRRDHPRLEELRRQYRNHPAARASLWTESYVRRSVDLQAFRGDNAYVWQLREGTGEASYLLTAYYARDVDRLGLLERLREDDLFGCRTFRFEGDVVVSRDLLDSILEINFLEDALGLAKFDGLSVLDVGAGYGRFAVRLTQALSNVKAIFCTDAVPESTFLCEFYLRFREVDTVARAAPLPEIEVLLGNQHIDLVTNIHSFTECPLESTRWWLDRLAEHRIKFLFIVPSTREALVSLEADGRRLDLLPSLRERGFELLEKRPKYENPGVQRHGVFPTHYYLFERRL